MTGWLQEGWVRLAIKLAKECVYRADIMALSEEGRIFFAAAISPTSWKWSLRTALEASPLCNADDSETSEEERKRQPVSREADSRQ